MVANRECFCCENRVVNKILDLDFFNDENNILPLHYDIVYCPECGMCYADMCGEQSLYNKYYEQYNNYVYDANVKIADLSGTPYEKISNIIEKTIDVNASIVDIGCGGGEVLQMLREKGFKNLLGIDPSANSIENLYVHDIKGKIGNIFDEINDEDEAKFDLVISTCVIEHIYDVNVYINKLKRYIKRDGGKILLVAPSAEGFCKHYTHISNYFNHEHINYFSIHSLDNIMKKHMMKRISSEYSYFYKQEEFVYGFYETSSSNMGISKDETSMNSINLYLMKYQNEKEKIGIKINKLISEGNQLIIFGVGQLLEWILVNYPQIKNNILFMVDNNIGKQGSLFAGKSIVAPINIKHHQKCKVVVCSMLYSNDIVAQLSEMNVDNEIVVI